MNPLAGDEKAPPYVTMEPMNAAMKNLYAVQTPEKKAVADQRFGHAGGPRMPFGPRGG